MTTTFNSRDYLNNPNFLGFDSIFDKFNTIDWATKKQQTYPPYNLHRRGDEEYVIEVAVAGFDENNIDVKTHKGVLTISGSRGDSPKDVVSSEKGDFTCYYQGIGERDFKLSWNMADTLKVKNAEMNNGILSVYLENEIPEEAKPKMIPINGVTKQTQTFLTEDMPEAA